MKKLLVLSLLFISALTVSAQSAKSGNSNTQQQEQVRLPRYRTYAMPEGNFNFLRFIVLDTATGKITGVLCRGVRNSEPTNVPINEVDLRNNEGMKNGRFSFSVATQLKGLLTDTDNGRYWSVFFDREDNSGILPLP